MAELNEARDWDEYLAWTRGADPEQYVQTEARAWERLQAAALRRRVQAFQLVAPEPEPEVEPEPAPFRRRGLFGP